MTERAPKPGVHPGLSREEYDAIPALRSTVAYRMLSTAPAKAIVPIEPTDPMALGTCCHDLMLEDAERFVISPYPDFRKKVAREWRDEQEAAGLIIATEEKVEKIRAIVAAGKKQINALEESWHFKDGDKELTIVWDDPIGVRCKARFDWKDGSAISDYKTAKGATPDSWVRTALPRGPAFSAAFYLRGASILWPGALWEWRWVVQDTEDPYLLFCVGLLADAHAVAARQVERAITIAKSCEDRGAYPGYSRFTYWADLPNYVTADMDEKEAMDDMEGILT